MKRTNSLLTYSIIAVAAVSLAACGSDRNRTATNSGANTGTEMARNTGAGTTGTADRTAANANLSSTDREFVNKAAETGMAEVELARLGEQKGSSDQVKDFAKKLADDHTKANDELKRIAGDMNVNLPSEMDSRDRKALDRLQNLSGAQFDREFLRMAQQHHQQDVQLFQHQAKNGENEQLKSFASNTLPTLQNHLETARSMHPGSGHSADRSSEADRSATGSEKSHSGTRRER